ncbi:MAG: PorP/SprF family type IX secretion system membrane protein [Bacteroidota bacterium]
MKKMKKGIAIVFWLLAMMTSHAQDPSFSQFFSSPLTINPALTANINEKWRLMSNYRNQWSGPANPYSTGTVSFESKIFQDVVGDYVDENTRVGIGGMMMYDESMGGALKSNYVSLNITGNIRLMKKEGYEQNGARIRHIGKASNDEGAEQRLGAALGISYGHRRLDISKLNFGEQFNGSAFDTNLPSGETALSEMKPWLSASAGLLYSFKKNYTQVDLGVAAFHVNKPVQTFLKDDNQTLARRYVVHGNLESFLSDKLILNANGVYQNQAGASYFSVGGALGYYMPGYEEGKDMIFNAGLWYWSDNAVIPYFGISYGKFQIGMTYDITISTLNEAVKRANTFELCLILRGNGRTSGVIPAPWK